MPSTDAASAAILASWTRISSAALLEQVRTGEVDIDGAIARLRHMPFEDLGFAKVDHHRALRHGMPEVIFAKGKTPEQVVAIAGSVLEHSPNRADHARRPRVRRRT